MRGSCFLGALVGVVTMASITIHMQTSASLMHDLSSASPVWIDQYAERFENAYEKFYHQLESQNSSSEGRAAENGIVRVDELAVAQEMNIPDAFAPAEATAAAAAFEAAAAIADDEASSTPAPTSTVVVVAPPLAHMAAEPLPPAPTAPEPESMSHPNMLPKWVLQQVPCAGTGSQYCARGLEPASPPPIMRNADKLEPIPANWLQELEDRNLPASFEAAARNALDSSAARPPAVCPPSVPGCRGSSPRDGPDGFPVEELPSDELDHHKDDASSSSQHRQRYNGACASLLAPSKPRAGAKTGTEQSASSSSNALIDNIAEQLQALLSLPSLSSSGAAVGATKAAAEESLEVAFTVLTSSELDLVDEFAATAERLGWVPADSSAKGGEVDPGGAPTKSSSLSSSSSSAAPATRFFVVAVGPSALAAACRAGHAVVHVGANIDPAAARYATSAALARQSSITPSSSTGGGIQSSSSSKPLAAAQWAFLADVWLLRDLNVLRSALSSSPSSSSTDSPDLLVALRLLPDRSFNKGTNNPSPDSGLWWAQSTPSTAALFQLLAHQASARATQRDAENGEFGPGRGGAKDPLPAGRGWLGGRGWGGLAATAGGVDEADEATFGCLIRSLPRGPWDAGDGEEETKDEEGSAQGGRKGSIRSQTRTRDRPLTAGVAAALRSIPKHCDALKPSTTNGQASQASVGWKDVRWGVLDGRLVGVDDRHPRPGPNMVAYRVPGNGHSGGRAAVKELGLWEGSNCYYCLGDIHHSPSASRVASRDSAAAATATATATTTTTTTTNHSHTSPPQPPLPLSSSTRKYLVYDGIVASNALPVYHRFPMTVATLNHLIALAFATDRILVLPAVLQMQKWMHAWEVVDTAVLDRFVSWRPATFFDHVAARTRHPAMGGMTRRGQNRSRDRQEWAWNASKVTGAQLMVRGTKGIGVKRLGPQDSRSHAQSSSSSSSTSRWFQVARSTTNGKGNSKGVSQRFQEWAVARNAPETRDATILFVKFRRTTEALVNQPCATNPQRLCTSQGVASAAWLEFHVGRSMHWCHHITNFKVALPNANEAAKKKGIEKKEWEHYDRYKTGAFIKPVDECAWPKPYVWPVPPESLTSFHAGGGGKDIQTSLAGKRSAPSLAAAAALWVTSAAHPCFGTAAAVLAATAAAAAGGKADSEPRGGSLSAVAALSAALWTKFEWANEMAEVGLLAGRSDGDLLKKDGAMELVPSGHHARNPVKAPENLRSAAYMQSVLVHLVGKGIANRKAEEQSNGICALPAFKTWPFEL